MRVLKRNPWLAGLGALLVSVVAFPPMASADVTTNRGASIVIFPKVIADGTRDTLIQLSNTSNGTVFAHCIYVNAAPEIPGVPAGPNNPRQWVERDFQIALTRQQPTIWRASTGRIVDPFASLGRCQEGQVGNATRQSCPGFSPGNVINLGPFFEGELKCIQTDASGAPVGGNALKGEAILEGPYIPFWAEGNISAYNAIGIIGISVDQDPELNLDGSEYNACPERVSIDHLAQNGRDPVRGAGAKIETELTAVPCTQNFLTQQPTAVVVQFLVYDEFENAASVSTTVDCWLNNTLVQIGNPACIDPTNPSCDPYDSIFDAYARGSAVLRTEMRPSSGSSSGILAVSEEFRIFDARDGGTLRTAAAASNAHVSGARASDVITLPAGVCQDLTNGGGTQHSCFNDGQCKQCVGGANDGQWCGDDNACAGSPCQSVGETCVF